MATIKQKQTAANKILRINKKSYSSKAELFSSALVDDKGNQYNFILYLILYINIYIFLYNKKPCVIQGF